MTNIVFFMTIFFVEKMASLKKKFLTVKWQFSGGSGSDLMLVCLDVGAVINFTFYTKYIASFYNEY